MSFGVAEEIDLPKWAEGLGDALPHGSGIDCNWYIRGMAGYIRCSNEFHCMNENGMYEGYQPFTVILRPNVKVTVHFNGSQYLAKKHMLREYLEDTISEMLSDFEWGKGFRKVLRAKDAEMVDYRLASIQHRIQSHVISGTPSFVDLSEAMHQIERLREMIK
jgi:hypothetical protein